MATKHGRLVVISFTLKTSLSPNSRYDLCAEHRWSKNQESQNSFTREVSLSLSLAVCVHRQTSHFRIF